MFPIREESAIDEETKKSELNGKCYEFDFETGQHIIRDGKFIECNTTESVKHFINHLLRTPKEKFKIYIVDSDNDYGLSIYKYIGDKNFHKGFIYSECKREIEEALLEHTEIKEVSNFDFKFKNTTLTISFTVYLKNNEKLEIKEAREIGL